MVQTPDFNFKLRHVLMRATPNIDFQRAIQAFRPFRPFRHPGFSINNQTSASAIARHFDHGHQPPRPFALRIRLHRTTAVGNRQAAEGIVQRDLLETRGLARSGLFPYPAGRRLLDMPSTATMLADTVVPEDVTQFCASRQLLSTLHHAIGLAEECFRPIRSLNIEMDVDPETGEDGVVILVGVSMAVDEVLRCKAAYTRQWIDSVPSDSRHRIRLVFHVI
jgi:hypothetical protein